MNIGDMKTPRNRREFERNFNLLKEMLLDERMHLPREFGNSLLRVRYHPNKRIDFLTVDERVRLQANMCANLPSFKKLTKGNPPINNRS